jgi:hypothetical protein
MGTVVNTTELANATGLTTRQIHHWVDKEWFFPNQQEKGRGHEQEWPRKEVVVLQKTAVLVRMGWAAREASWYARTAPETIDEILIAIGRASMSPPPQSY